MNLDNVQLRLLDSVDDAVSFMAWLGERRPLDALAIDTETTGLSPERDRVRLIQIGDGQTGWAIGRDEWLGVARAAIQKWQGQWIAHNARFDNAMLRESCDIELPADRTHDTRLMAHVLDSTGSTALKSLTSRFVDSRAAVGQDVLAKAMRESGWDWETVPIDFAPYWQYGALDPVLTYRLFEVLYPQVQAEAPKAYEIESGASWITERMERHGFRIDQEYVEQQAQRLTAYVTEAEQWCQATHGVRPGSNAEVIKALTAQGITFTKRTTGGSISLDKEVLSSIDHPLAQTVLQRRQAQKLLSTYFEAFLKHSEYDGYVHPSINVIGGFHRTTGESGGGRGVRTGRMSCSDPNLQNVPVRTKESKIVRNAFIPSDGNTLIMCDFEQIEMRLLASLSRDQAMINAFTEGDFFVNLGRQVFNDPEMQKDDPRRSFMKNASYAKIYGAGAAKFAQTAGVTIEAANVFLNQFDATYPGVRRMQREVEQIATSRRATEGSAYVRCPLTNRKHISDPGREYTLVNYLIQGMAAAILKIKIIELDQAGLSEYLVIPVHDEVILDVPHAEIDTVVETLTNVMNDESIVTVPILASISKGKRWGEKEEI